MDLQAARSFCSLVLIQNEARSVEQLDESLEVVGTHSQDVQDPVLAQEMYAMNSWIGITIHHKK